MTTEQLAYLAGLFDGEGSVGLYVNNPKATDHHSIVLRVSVSNTDRGVLEWAKATVGSGSIRQKEDSQHTRKTAWVWSLCSCQAVDFLEHILPWLHIKTAQVEVVLALSAYGQRVGMRQGTKPSSELQDLRRWAAHQVKLLKYAA